MIDFHVHIDLYPDPAAPWYGSAIPMVCNVLSVTTTPSAWKGTSELALPGSRMRTALGSHPQIAHQRKSELERSMLTCTKHVMLVKLDWTVLLILRNSGTISLKSSIISYRRVQVLAVVCYPFIAVARQSRY